jgi:hypothetical protein
LQCRVGSEPRLEGPTLGVAEQPEGVLLEQFVSGVPRIVGQRNAPE